MPSHLYKQPKKETIISVSIVACCFVLAMIIVIAAKPPNPDQKYCELESCKGKNHTMCIYPKEIHKNCGHCSVIGLTVQQKNLFMKYFGDQSEKAEKGRPSFRINWDAELTKIAQRWANQCRPGRDECRNALKFEVGQIVYPKKNRKVRQDAPPGGKSSESESTKKTLTDDKVTNSTMGCGYLQCKKDGVTQTRIVCNYGPVTPELTGFMELMEIVLNKIVPLF